MLLLRSLAFALIFYTGSLVMVMSALTMSLVSGHALRRVARRWGRFHRWCAHHLLGQKVRMIGEMPVGPMLYIFKHESMFETIDQLIFFVAPMVAAKKELIDIPLWGKVARLHGIIPVEREAGAASMRAMRKAALAGLAEGRPIILFPEGTRVPHGERPPLRAGFAGLYALLKVPVVPVAVDSGRVAPRGKFLKRPGTVTYKVGEIIPPGLKREEAEARAHAAINALNP